MDRWSQIKDAFVSPVWCTFIWEDQQRLLQPCRREERQGRTALRCQARRCGFPVTKQTHLNSPFWDPLSTQDLALLAKETTQPSLDGQLDLLRAATGRRFICGHLTRPSRPQVAHGRGEGTSQAQWEQLLQKTAVCKQGVRSRRAFPWNLQSVSTWRTWKYLEFLALQLLISSLLMLWLKSF